WWLSYQSLNAFGITSSAPPRKTNMVTDTGEARRTRTAAVAARTGFTPTASAPTAAPDALRTSRRLSLPVETNWLSFGIGVLLSSVGLRLAHDSSITALSAGHPAWIRSPGATAIAASFGRSAT